jgi:phosphotransferase system HPr (HPr) family protein
MPSLNIKIDHEVGLHARPAAEFVKLASSFPCDIQVKNNTTDSKSVNAKSILGVLTLGVNQGHTIILNAEGEQAEEALEALEELIQSNFGE